MLFILLYDYELNAIMIRNEIKKIVYMTYLLLVLGEFEVDSISMSIGTASEYIEFLCISLLIVC